MRLDLKSAGLAMTVLLVLPWLPLPVSAAQPSALTIALTETSDLRKLLETAKQHYRRAEFKQAIALYQRSIELSKQQGTRSNQAQAMAELGSVYAEIEKTQEAEALMLSALKLAQTTGDRRVESDVLAALVSLYLGQPDLKKAKDFNQAAQIAAEAAGYQKGIARAKTVVSAIRWLELLQQKQFQQALEVSREVLTLAQGTGDQDDIAIVYSLQFLTYSALQDTVQAEKLFQQHQAFSQTIGFRLEEYRGLKLAGDLTDLQKQPEKKVAYYQQALALAWAADNPWLQRSVLLEIGWFYVNQKQTPKALEAYQKVLTLAKTIDATAVADVQNRIGVAYYRAEQYPQALAAYQQALATYPKTKDNQAGIAQVWINIGDVHWQLKQYSRTVEALQQALALYQQLKNENSVGDVENRLGNTFSQMEHYPQALAAYQRALAVYKQLNNENAVADVENRIGLTYYRSKQYPQALAVFQQALAGYQSINKQPETAQVWQNIGLVYKEQKQYPQALEAFQKALVLYRQVPNQIQEGDVLGDIGYTYFFQSEDVEKRQKDYSQAEKLALQGQEAFQQKLALARKRSNRQQEHFALLGIASLYWRQARVKIALGHYAEALELYVKALKPQQEALDVAREMNDAAAVKRVLRDIAVTHNSLLTVHNTAEQYSQVLELSKTAMEAAKATGDPEREEAVLGSIKNAYSTMSRTELKQRRYPEAIAAAQEAVRLAKLLNDTETELSQTSNIVQAYENQGKYDLALESLQQQLTLARETHSLEMEGLSLTGIGSIYDRWGNYPQALNIYQQALKIGQAQPDRTQEALALNNIAYVYQLQGQYKQSLSYQKQAFAIYQNIWTQFGKGVTPSSIRAVCATEDWLKKSFADTCSHPEILPTGYVLDHFKSNIWNHAYLGRNGVADGFGNLAVLYSYQGKYREALKLHQQALAIHRELKDSDKEAHSLHNLSAIYGSLGDSQQALTLAQQALKIAQTNRNLTRESFYSRDLGVLYGNFGRFPEALKLLERSLSMSRELKQPVEEADVISSIALIYANQAKYAEALKLYQQALKMQRVIGVRPQIINTLLFIGLVYRNLGQYDQAISLCKQALNIAQEIGDRPQEAKSLLLMGGIYRRSGQLNKSQAYFQKGLAMFREIGDQMFESSALFGLGALSLEQAQPNKAFTFLQQAVSLYRQMGLRPQEAEALSFLGRVHTQLGKEVRAQEILQQSIALATEFGDRSTQAQALSNMGQLFTKQNQPELAIVFYKQSVKLTEDIRKGIRTLPKDQQQSYTETVADTYRQLADLLLKRDRVLEAQQVLDLLKIQELDDYLRNVRGGGQPLYELPPEQAILNKYNALNQSAIVLGQELNSLQEIARSGKALTSAQEQRKQQLLALQKELKQQFNDFAHDKEVAVLLKQLTITEPNVTIQLEDLAGFSKKLANNAVMLYPLVLDDRLELIITAPNAQPLRRTINVTRQELNQTIKEFRDALQNPTRDAKPAAQKLYNWLIKPLEKDLQAAKPETIIYAPDGTLRYIPLAALYDGQKWLVERYAINNITSKSVDDLTTKPKGNLRVLAGAFGTVDQKVSFAGQTIPFTGLAFTIKEVEALAKRLPGTVKLLGQAFTPTATTRQMNEYTIVHLATHASLMPEVGNSFIVFGDGTATSLTDIDKWTLDTVDLVVLSACQTGLGGKFGKNGEEVLGLGYQFTKEGQAKAAIASLWSVNDGGTQVLMDAFYANLQTGKTKAEALRQAQVTLIAGKAEASGSNRAATLVARWQGQLPSKVINQLNHPYYWAPFILIGNGL